MTNTRHRKIAYRDRGAIFVEPCDVADAVAAGERVFMLGKAPNAGAMLSQLDRLPGARVYLDQHHPVVTCKVDGRTHTVTWASAWFGDGDYTTADCDAAWAKLAAAIRHAWKDDTAALLLTPATTGRDLWLRTVPRDGWPVLAQPDQAFIRSTAGQGRVETFRARGETVPRLYEYDARLAYLAVTRNLPVGPPLPLAGEQAEVFASENPYKPGRYLVTWTVPAGWHSAGILPQHLGDTPGVDRLWHWPTEPGRVHGPAWVDAVELFTARRWGWDVTVRQAIVWTATGDPLRTWQERLGRVLADHGEGDDVQAGMMRSALRALALHGIGAMHGADRRITHVGDDPPADARDVRVLRSGQHVWHTFGAPAWPELCHPEWTSVIWSRARARLLDAPGETGALHLPANTVVALWTDAIYTTEATGWTDDGKIGRYRLKGVFHGGPWPRSSSDITRMKARPVDGA